MNPTSTASRVPGFLWRVATLLGLWFIIFGTVTALTPWHMEGGYDVTSEKLKATLFAPIFGCIGLAAFFGGHSPSLPSAILSFAAILGSAALMLFRCRTVRTFWALTAVHIIIVAVSSIGFSQVTQYWNENP